MGPRPHRRGGGAELCHLWWRIRLGRDPSPATHLEEAVRPLELHPCGHRNASEVVAPIHALCSRLTYPRKVGGMSQELLSGEPLPSQELTAF